MWRVPQIGSNSRLMHLAILSRRQAHMILNWPSLDCFLSLDSRASDHDDLALGRRERTPMMSGAGAGKHDGSSESSRTERRQDERRRALRFPFTASVYAIEPKSHAKLSGRSSDISQGGCYIDTISPFPVQTVIKIRLTKDGVSFEAD